MKRTFISLFIAALLLGGVVWADGTDSKGNYFAGTGSGGSITSADANTGIGYYALPNLTTGRGNIAYGYMAGESVTTGSHGLFITNRFYPTYGFFGDFSTGYFGVNNTSPAVALDVTGAITASSTITGAAFVGSGQFTVANSDTVTLSAEAIVQWASEADTSTVKFVGDKIHLYGSDGDAATIDLDTGDQLDFAGAGGGYSFDGAISGTTATLTGRITPLSVDADTLMNNAGGVLVVADSTKFTQVMDVDANIDGTIASFSGRIVPLSVDTDTLLNNAGGVLVVGDSTKFTQPMDIDGAMDVSANIAGTTASLTGRIQALSADVDSIVNIAGGEVVVGDSAKVTGSVDIDGNLNVDGTSTLVGAVTVSGNISDANSETTVSDSLIVTGTINGLTRICAVTSDTVMTTANFPSGSTITSAGLNNITLPTAAAGLNYKFIAIGTDSTKVYAGASDNIDIPGDPNETEVVAAGVADELIAIEAIDNTSWKVLYYIGTWDDMGD